MGEQRQHEILVGDGLAHLVLPEFILDQETVQATPFHRRVLPLAPPSGALRQTSAVWLMNCSKLIEKSPDSG